MVQDPFQIDEFPLMGTPEEKLNNLALTRQTDIVKFNNLQNVLIRGRKVEKVPTSISDVVATDRLGDINFTAEFTYVLIDNAGTLEWRFLLASPGKPIRTFDVELNNFRKGATAPVNTTIGSTPTIPVLNFSAVGELLSMDFAFPADADMTQDVTIVLDFTLAVVQVNNDTLDITMDYVAHGAPDPANGPDKTSTTVLGQTTVTTANGLAVNDPYQVIITLDANDATNPFGTATRAELEMHLTNTTGVGDVNFLGARINYTAKY